MKRAVNNFFGGASSITLYPSTTAVKSASMQGACQQVWNSFAVVNKTLNGTIYGYAGHAGK